MQLCMSVISYRFQYLERDALGKEDALFPYARRPTHESRPLFDGG